MAGGGGGAGGGDWPHSAGARGPRATLMASQAMIYQQSLWHGHDLSCCIRSYGYGLCSLPTVGCEEHSGDPAGSGATVIAAVVINANVYLST